MTSATAVAGTNIALVKYWGKRDEALNLPATGSLSLTLDRLGTRTRVAFDGGDGAHDRVTLDGAPASEKVAARVTTFLDRVRARAGIAARATVVTDNSVPTASGLASSASGFAALALAATRRRGARAGADRAVGAGAARLGLGGALDLRRLRRDGARRRAPTAATRRRVRWMPAPAGDVRLVVAITAAGEKALGSTAAMRRTAETSPYYEAWVRGVDGDLAAARAAIAGARPDGAGRRRRAERDAHARQRHGRRSADPLLEPRDHRGDGARPRAARRGGVRLLHHRRRPARQGAVRRARGRARSRRRWRRRRACCGR